MIELVQHIFVSSNSGVNRTYTQPILSQAVTRNIPKGQTSKFTHDFKIPNVEHQTAIGTLVANHYRLEISPYLGAVSSNNPCVYSPLFILKKEFDLRSVARPRQISDDLK